MDVLDNRTQSTNRCKRRQRRRQQRPHLGRGQESPQELREAGRVGAAANDPLDAPGHGAEVPRGQLHQRRRGPVLVDVRDEQTRDLAARGAHATSEGAGLGQARQRRVLCGNQPVCRVMNRHRHAIEQA